jgi:hypothetical protein
VAVWVSLVAFWGVQSLGNGAAPARRRARDWCIDAWVMAFTLGVSVFTGLAFDCAGGSSWRTDVNAALKEEVRGDTGGTQPPGTPVVSEVALRLRWDRRRLVDQSFAVARRRSRLAEGVDV